MTNPKAEGLYTVKRWGEFKTARRSGFVRTDAKGSLTELVVGPGYNLDSRTQYRSNVGDPDRTLAIEGDLLVLTEEDGVVIMVKQKDEYRRVIPSCKQCLPLIVL